jgi:hypothetical protein
MSPLSWNERRESIAHAFVNPALEENGRFPNKKRRFVQLAGQQQSNLCVVAEWSAVVSTLRAPV